MVVILVPEMNDVIDVARVDTLKWFMVVPTVQLRGKQKLEISSEIFSWSLAEGQLTSCSNCFQRY